jgi:hypothetical protein
MFAFRDGIRASALDCRRPTDPRLDNVAQCDSCGLLQRVPVSRELGLYSSALSIVPKEGFVSAFKRGSYPPAPVFVRRAN